MTTSDVKPTFAEGLDEVKPIGETIPPSPD